MQNETGFTLTELLATMAIAAILITLAVPSFEETMRNNRLTMQANDLVTSFALARSEAIKRRTTVTICPSTDEAACDPNAAWNKGWIVRDEAGSAVIRAFPAMKGDTVVTTATNQVRYGQTGFLVGGATVSLRLCSGTGHPGRQIAITAAGRPANQSPYPAC